MKKNVFEKLLDLLQYCWINLSMFLRVTKIKKMNNDTSKNLVLVAAKENIEKKQRPFRKHRNGRFILRGVIFPQKTTAAIYSAFGCSRNKPASQLPSKRTPLSRSSGRGRLSCRDKSTRRVSEQAEPMAFWTVAPCSGRCAATTKRQDWPKQMRIKYRYWSFHQPPLPEQRRQTGWQKA